MGSLYGPRVLLWCLAIGGLFLAFVSLSANQHALAYTGFGVMMICPGLAEAYAQRRRRSDWYRREFGTQEEFVSSIDTDGLRRVRDEKGTIEAVRALRRQYPHLPLKVAADTVEQL